jgi:hypothetical protein
MQCDLDQDFQAVLQYVFLFFSNRYHIFYDNYSHKDRDWVQNMLLRNLESTYAEQDIAFKGMYNILCVYE